MTGRKVGLFILSWAVVFGCASTPKAKPKTKTGAKPAEATKSGQNTETRAFEAERRVNAAETELLALRPDTALEQLEAARDLVNDPAIDTYPEARQLRDRHRALVEKVPLVREDVRRRDLAAAVEVAKGKIETARTDLKKVIVQIRKKDPQEGELKHASEAVEGVRSALDEGEKLEAQDAVYSKFTLGCRKELLAQQKIVEQRQVDVAVDTGRQEISRAVAVLGTALTQLKKKEVSDGDLDRARAAGEALQAAIGATESLVKKDVGHAKYVAQVKQKLAADRDTIAKREHEVTVDRARALISKELRTLGEALSVLKGAQVAEAAFVSAEEASGGVSKVLEQGLGLESKDLGYAAYAKDVRARLTAASTKVSTRKIEVLVGQKKKEIAGARSKLDESSHLLKKAEPSDREFEEAKASVAEVEKVLDSGEELSAKEPTFAKHLLEVRKSLQGARSRIEARKLEVEVAAQRGRVVEGLGSLKRALSRLSASEDLSSAETAVAELDKTLEAGEPYGPKDPRYSKLAIEARKSSVLAAKRIKERAAEIAAKIQSAKLREASLALTSALGALDGFSPGEGEFKVAEDATSALKKVLDEGVEIEKGPGAYRALAALATKAQRSAEDRIEKRRLAVSGRERKMLAEQALSDLKTAVGALKKLEATKEDVDRALGALKSAREELVKGTELEKKDSGYASFGASSKKRVDALEEELESAKHSVAFRTGPIAALTSGLESLQSAGALSPEGQKKAYSTAHESFRACKNDAASILAERPRLASFEFTLGKKKKKGAAVLSACADHEKATEGKLALIDADLAFYEGPAKSFEQGKTVLSSASGAPDSGARKKVFRDALGQFEACIETGRLLANKRPELKKKAFEVSGQKVTLAEVVKVCQEEAENLRSEIQRL